MGTTSTQRVETRDAVRFLLYCPGQASLKAAAAEITLVSQGPRCKGFH